MTKKLKYKYVWFVHYTWNSETQRASGNFYRPNNCKNMTKTLLDIIADSIAKNQNVDRSWVVITNFIRLDNCKNFFSEEIEND